MNTINFNNTVVVIHDGRKGHLNPSLAVAEVIQDKYSLTPQQFQLPIHLNKKLVSIFKKLSNFPLFFRMLGQLVFKTEPKQINTAEIIICSGMPNLIYAAFLAQKYSLPLLYVGNLRKFNEKLIDVSITALAQNVNCKQIILPTPPVSLKFKAVSNPQNNHEAVLLLGGSTIDYPFSKQDYSEMMIHFVQFIRSKKLKGSVICSRRTPELEQQNLDVLQENGIEFISQQQQFNMCEKLQNCKYIFVTEDSITMLSEAIHTGCVVTSICLDDSKSDELIEKYLNYGYIQRKKIQNLTQIIEQYSPIQSKYITQPLLQHLDRLYYQGHFQKAVLSDKKSKYLPKKAVS